MGWEPAAAGRQGISDPLHRRRARADDGTPIALGYHTGHWEVGLLMQRRGARIQGVAAPFPSPAFCTDPCDGRTQGTTGMMDSLPYRNDAAMVLSAADPLAAAAQRGDGGRDLRQRTARDDDGAGGDARSARASSCPAA